VKGKFLKSYNYFTKETKEKLFNFLKKDDASVVEWLIVLIACALLCAMIYTNVAPGIKNASQRMGNALIGNN